MDSYNWYLQLKKPSWAPPASLFGPVWSVLYLLIFLSFGTVFYKTATGTLPWFLAIPFALNLLFNFIFTYLQFGLKNNLLAAIDIILVAISLILALIFIYPFITWVVIINIPYLAWVLFATMLQINITVLNR
ncbi:MAG: TspO protein [Firmicutes bacterium ML8_F2]|jgi:translocator protein|nr:MAG: TspO protein [Firmicutes bacterium ML8_F2]